MNRWLLWATTAVLGAVTTLLTSLGLLAVLLFALLAAPLLIRGSVPAFSGFFTGFGGLWLIFMARQFSSGGRLDNAAWWTAVGAVPLVLGLGLLVLMVAREDRLAAPGGGAQIRR